MISFQIGAIELIEEDKWLCGASGREGRPLHADSSLSNASSARFSLVLVFSTSVKAFEVDGTGLENFSREVYNVPPYHRK